MKKLIAIILCFMMLPLNFALPAFAQEDTALKLIFEDTFDGTVGESVSANSDWSISGDKTNVTDTYAADPAGTNNTVLCIERTVNDTGREKFRLDLSAFNNGNYVTEDTTITFRFYNAGGTLRMRPRLRHQHTEGWDYGMINLYGIKGFQNKWCDVRLDLDVQEGTDGRTCTITGWATADGANETQFYTGDAKTFPTDNDGNWGIWQIDFETAYS